MRKIENYYESLIEKTPEYSAISREVMFLRDCQVYAGRDAFSGDRFVKHADKLLGKSNAICEVRGWVDFDDGRGPLMVAYGWTTGGVKVLGTAPPAESN